MTAHPVPDQHGANLYTTDPALRDLLQVYMPRELLAHLEPVLTRLGALAGGELDDLAGIADRNPPTLELRTRTGIDQQRIDKHPAYVEMERLAFGEFALAAISHRQDVLGWEGQLPAVVKYALTYLFVQAEFGLCCPVSMTDSLTRTLKKFGSPDLVQRWLPSLTSLDLDTLSQGAMFMTEQGAGSDIAATTTLARPDLQHPGAWLLTGDKWFCSNPDAALAMVLARVEGGPAGMKGVSLFLLPRDLEDGTHNHYRIIRLKDKLGTRSMASGEIRLEGARAWLVGEQGRGFVQMADMVNNSRLSNGVRAAGLMRRAVSEAMHVARNREAFGRKLIDLPLMRRQLLKLQVPAEQARTMVFQTAQALRAADAGDEAAKPLARILTPLIKFRACRDARKVTGDAMEVRGGCGYIEEWADPRLVRDAHLGSIWEGTSNIVALDVVRAIRREGSLAALQSHWQSQLDEMTLDAALRARLQSAAKRATALAQAAAEAGQDAIARQAASALYHVTSAIAMCWEAHRMGKPQRTEWADLVLRHRLEPKDPLAADMAPLNDSLLAH
ncbi:acyl-CoA dehydrogenase family protein [Ramlibacter albus]|uniref:Acyl-CoA dehydrogenase family protein n=1 Tax=Ramlibacter albus TaxID=2079448 RepID=A0A923MFK8_9BURK|nr:acyl-CoA dehydrogenase family protein [Ramlibacter albus]MBC5768643.1 acyl-CoA dehydrogenase family protein [Ramlibacter albus]